MYALVLRPKYHDLSSCTADFVVTGKQKWKNKTSQNESPKTTHLCSSFVTVSVKFQPSNLDYVWGVLCCKSRRTKQMNTLEINSLSILFKIPRSKDISSWTLWKYYKIPWLMSHFSFLQHFLQKFVSVITKSFFT